MIELDLQSRTPIYEQIMNEIKRNILAGLLKPNDQIPSIRELANTLGVNPNTVKKSYSALESQNIIQSVSTRGTFITEKIDHILQEAIDMSFDKIKKEINQLEMLGISKEQIIESVCR